jgi:hypothetical protein
MTTTNQPQLQFFDDSDSDTASLESLDTDDGEDHLPEKILAQLETPRHLYLLKWKDCPVVRSSWEDCNTIQILVDRVAPTLVDDWELEKERQRRGISKPLDLVAFTAAVSAIEKAERQRRVLRRLHSKVNRVLSVVIAP